MNQLAEVMDLLIELEDVGVSSVFTDGQSIYLFPASKLSMRLQADVRFYKQDLLKANLPHLPNHTVMVIGDVVKI
jgi:hypothetical protein